MLYEGVCFYNRSYFRSKQCFTLQKHMRYEEWCKLHEKICLEITNMYEKINKLPAIQILRFVL